MLIMLVTVLNHKTGNVWLYNISKNSIFLIPPGPCFNKEVYIMICFVYNAQR